MFRDYISCALKAGEYMYEYEERRRFTVHDILELAESILESETKRHIVGGALLSVSFLFGGLAITAMTVKKGDNNELEP